MIATLRLCPATPSSRVSLMWNCSAWQEWQEIFSVPKIIETRSRKSLWRVMPSAGGAFVLQDSGMSVPSLTNWVELLCSAKWCVCSYGRQVSRQRLRTRRSYCLISTWISWYYIAPAINEGIGQLAFVQFSVLWELRGAIYNSRAGWLSGNRKPQAYVPLIPFLGIPHRHSQDLQTTNNLVQRHHYIAKGRWPRRIASA